MVATSKFDPWNTSGSDRQASCELRYRQCPTTTPSRNTSCVSSGMGHKTVAILPDTLMSPG